MKVICKIKYTINCKLIYLRKGNLLVYIKDDTAIVIEKGLSSLRYPESKKYTPAIGYVWLLKKDCSENETKSEEHGVLPDRLY